MTAPTMLRARVRPREQCPSGPYAKALARVPAGNAIPLILLLPASKRATIIALATVAAPKKTIADVTRISRTTLYKWLRGGTRVLDSYEQFDDIPREPPDVYAMASLAADYLEARARGYMSLMTHALEQARQSPDMLRWLLPLLYPQEFSEPKRVAVAVTSYTVTAQLVREKFAGNHIDTDGVTVC